MTARRTSALPALAALVLAGCSEPAAPAPPPAPAARVRRPALEALGDAGPVLPAAVDSIPVPADLGAWAVDAGAVELAAPPAGLPGIERGLRLSPAAGSDEVRVDVPGDFDPAALDRVAVLVESPGMMFAKAAFLRAGEEVRRAFDSPAVPGGKGPRVVRLDFSNVPDDLAPFDGLRLTFRRALQPFTLYRVDTVRVPPTARLPQVADGAGLVEIGGEARRAVALSDRRPLVARFEAPERARLSFSYGWPGPVSAEGRAATLIARVRVDGAPALEARYPLLGHGGRPNPNDRSGRGARWSQAVLGLAPFAGRSVAVEFEIDAEGDAEAVCALGPPQVSVDAAAAPSVLLVTSDTHRYDHVGRAPGAALATPAIDALADRGLFFEDCLSAANVTLPAHVAILTGATPRDSGVFQNSVPVSGDPETLAERFRDAGWATVAVVSTRHLGDPESGLGQGFDRMSWPARTPRTAAESVAVLERWLSDFGDRPLFCWLHVFDAHAPYTPPSRYAERHYPPGRDPTDAAYRTVDFPQPKQYRGVVDVEHPRAMYRAEVEYLDAQLARVLERPRFAGGVVAFTADHGESLGAHDVWWDHAGLYPDSLHVPLVLAWPGARPGRVAAPVSQVDLPRTLLELCGVDATGFPGRSLVAAGPDVPRFAVASARESASVTLDGHHLILALREHSHEKSSARPRVVRAHATELYDLARDPGCETDLVPVDRATARRLRALLVDWLSGASGGWAAGAAPDAATVRELAALGYVFEAGLDGEPLFDPECSCERCRAFAPD